MIFARRIASWLQLTQAEVPIEKQLRWMLDEARRGVDSEPDRVEVTVVWDETPDETYFGPPLHLDPPTFDYAPEP